MNVLHLANYSAPYAGNFILSLLNLESKLADGVTVYLFPEETSKKEYVSKLNHVYYLNGRVVHDTLLIKHLLKKHKINVVHSHFTSSKQNLALLISILFTSKVRYIKHEHGEVKKSYGLKRLVRQFLRIGVDVYIPCNYPISEQLINDHVSSQKIQAVPNAIDFSRLNVFEEMKKGDKIEILMFGSDWYRKGGDIAIKAVREMKNTRLNIALSSGLEYVKDRIIADFGEIPEFVRFLVPRNDVATYYHMADVFISPSRSEGLPYSVIEAMYCETLVVVSDILPQQNIVPDEFMFQSENPVDLVKKMEYTLNIKDIKAITTEFKKMAESNYNLENWSNRVLLVYKDQI